MKNTILITFIVLLCFCPLLVSDTHAATSTESCEYDSRTVTTDALVTVCKGNVITHTPSDLKITVRSYNDNYMRLKLNGSRTRYISVHKDRVRTVTTNNGSKVEFTYPTPGAFQITLKSSPEDENCTINDSSNSAGNDGSYSACVGNTITHYISGLKAKVIDYNDSYVDIFISELPGGNATTLRIKKGARTHIGGNNGYEVIYEYGGSHSSTGAYITISSNKLY